jgi:hypothetical protein
MSKISKVIEYLNTKCAGEINLKTTLRKDCLTIFLTVLGISKAFYEKVSRREVEVLAPDWTFSASMNKMGDLVISKKFSKEETYGIFQQPGVKTKEMLGDEVVDLLKKIPAKTMAPLWERIQQQEATK